ncbi:MAG: XkdF-like putative serine protease domain-containing protein, partial [Flammeovirgaceae bacterium]
MSQKFLRQRRTDETSVEHDGIKLGADKVWITESWVSEDPVKDKSATYGFELPVGTWFVSMKIEDDKVWEQIKKKELNGFSVEGLFAEKSYFSSEAEIINTIKEILKSIKDE